MLFEGLLAATQALIRGKTLSARSDPRWSLRAGTAPSNQALAPSLSHLIGETRIILS